MLRGDIDVALPKLSFDLLMALIEAAPRIVTTDELMDRVWTGLVVSPETVSQRVSLLRAALGDNSKKPRYVAGCAAVDTGSSRKSPGWTYPYRLSQ